VASGGGDAAWTYQVIQVQVPAIRTIAGILLDPPVVSELEPRAEYERSIRARYGVPEPGR
jgi:hypothetical protein